jgi:BirA family biotin operon repressor/biotin-[acetyl-CoA-carboxylase] ligase
MAKLPQSWSLNTAYIGRHVLQFEQLESTNTTALELAAGHPDGLAVIANVQTAGRGQYGRVWQAQAGSSLLMSVTLRLPLPLGRPVVLTALAGVAVGDAIFQLIGVQSRIKWPNDLLLQGKKVCGILIERHGEIAIIGIGLNLSQTHQDFMFAGLPQATSLGIVASQVIDIPQAANTVLHCLDREYVRLLQGEHVAIEADWKWRLGLLGRRVLAELTDGQNVEGRLIDLSFDRVDLETSIGITRRLIPECVRHLRRLSDSL